jgi:hypothetical protein
MRKEGLLLKMREKESKEVIPSEQYLLRHRLFTFLDEWLFYLVLGILYYTGEIRMMGIVAVVGVAIIMNTYRLQWKMEKKRFDGIPTATCNCDGDCSERSPTEKS